MTRYYSNTAVTTTLTTVGGIDASVTNIAVADSSGWPTGFPFTMRLEPGTVNEELVEVASGAGSLGSPWVVTRGFDGTTAKAHAFGAAITHSVSAIDFVQFQGSISAQLLNGAAVPTTEGNDGDFYLRTTNYVLYGPKAAGAWGSGTSLVGAAGSNGAAGTNGTNGTNGAAGSAGAAGAGFDIDVRNAPYSAVGNGSTDDAAAIQAAIDACPPGGVVWLGGAKRYAIGVPLELKPGVCLMGSAPQGKVYYSDFGVELAALYGLPGFTGDAMITLVDATTGGYGVDSRNQSVIGVNLVGWDLPASIHGVKISGQVQDTVFRNVLIQGVTGVGFLTDQDGSGTWPNTIHLESVSTLETTDEGFYLENCADLNVVNCAADDSTGADGWYITGVTNAHFTGCRAEHNKLNGYHLTGDFFSAEGSDGILFVDCSTDRNERNGILVDATPGTGPFGFVGLRLGRDGRNANAGGGGYAGLKVTSATNPVWVTGISVFPGVDDDGSGVSSPQIGVSATGSTSFEVRGGVVHAATTAVVDGGTNGVFVVDDLAVATGPTNAPVRSRRSYKDRATVAGWYHATDGPDTTQALTQSRMLLFPFQARTALVDQVAVEVTTLASSSTVRLGIYADNGNGRPGDLVVDFGTVSSTTTGVKTINVSQALIPGRDYWLAAVAQGGAPSVRATAGSPNKLIQLGTSAPASLASAVAYYQPSVTAGLPTPFTYTATQAVAYAPMVAILWG